MLSVGTTAAPRIRNLCLPPLPRSKDQTDLSHAYAQWLPLDHRRLGLLRLAHRHRVLAMDGGPDNTLL